MSPPPVPNADAIRPFEGSTLATVQSPLTLEALVFTYYADIWRLAYSILDDAPEADDVAQETFIGAGTALDTFRGASSVKTWLFGIAINICKSRLRKQRTRRALYLALEAIQLLRPPQESPEALVEQHETREQLWKAVASLDEKHRLPVVLYYIHDLSVADISTILKLQPGTVYSRLHYARKQLHAVLLQNHPPSRPA